MTQLRFLVSGLMAALLFTPAASRAQTLSSTRALSIDEALRLGQGNIPQLVRARAEQQVVESRKAGAKLWLQQNPYATVMVGQRTETTSTPVAAGVQYQVHIEQALEIAGQRWTRLAVVASQTAAAKAQTALAQVESRALLWTTYMQASLSDERVRVARKREEIAEQLLRSAQARMELGATGGLEVNLAQVERGRVRGERTQAEVQLTNRHAALGILCGVTPGTPLLLTSSHMAPPQLATTDVSLPSLLAMAEAHRADLAAVRLQEQALAAEVSKLRREAVPNLVLSFDYQRDLPGQEFWGGTVGLTLPVWNRNQGPLAQVHAAELQRQAEERLLRTRIHGEVAAAQRKLVLLRSQVREFEQEVIPPAERSIELLRQGWQAGKFDLFRVITASRELAETRLRLLDLLEELWATAIETERVVGMPLLVGGSS